MYPKIRATMDRFREGGEGLMFTVGGWENINCRLENLNCLYHWASWTLIFIFSLFIFIPRSSVTNIQHINKCQSLFRVSVREWRWKKQRKWQFCQTKHSNSLVSYFLTLKNPGTKSCGSKTTAGRITNWEVWPHLGVGHPRPFYKYWRGTSLWILFWKTSQDQLQMSKFTYRILIS